MFANMLLLFANLIFIGYTQQLVTITISNTIINVTDERFVSFTIDTSQLDHSEVNLTNPQMIYLASQYTPSILRVGGTHGDYTYYEVGSEDPCHLPDSSYSCLSMKMFNDLISYAAQISADLVFGLSMGYPTYPADGSTKAWNYTNTQAFLNYIINTRKYTNNDIYGFELGNEVNQGEPYKVPTVQANAFKKLKQILTSMNSNATDRFKLFGPDPHSYTLRENTADFDYIPNFVGEACEVLDGLTYHCYVNQNESALLTPDGLNEQYRESLRVSNIFNNKTICESNKDLIHNIFAGEIAEHNNGGISGVTNTYYDGFWYLDALGTISSLGHAIFARQTFAKSSYGLLDYNYNPNCDYFTGLLFNNLMLNKVLDVKSNENNFRIYAHCANPKTFNGVLLKNPVSMAYINLYDKNVDISYDKSVIGEGDIYIYTLTPYNKTAGLKSETMSLNGNELKLDANGKLPNMNGKKISAGSAISVPKQSYGFFVFTQTTITSCT